MKWNRWATLLMTGGALVGLLLYLSSHIHAAKTSANSLLQAASSPTKKETFVEHPAPIPQLPKIIPIQVHGSTDSELPAEIGKLKTATGEKLLSYYKRGLLPSASPADKYLATVVQTYCNGYVNPSSITRQTGKRHVNTPAEDPKVAIWQDRISIMAERCAPLAGIGKSVWLDEGMRLTQELEATGSMFARSALVSEEGTSISKEQIDQERQNIREALDTYGVVALEWKGGSLLRLASLDGRRTGRMDLFNGEDAGVMAVGIASCYADQPCGSDSLGTIGVCVGTGGRDCEEDLVQASLDALQTPADRERTVKLARDLVAAIESRNWRALGID